MDSKSAFKELTQPDDTGSIRFGRLMRYPDVLIMLVGPSPVWYIIGRVPTAQKNKRASSRQVTKYAKKAQAFAKDFYAMDKDVRPNRYEDLAELVRDNILGG